jgi:hypothetical protein
MMTATIRPAAARVFFVCVLCASVPAPAEDAPKKEPTAKECIADGGGLKLYDNKPAFVIELSNTCEQRIRCKVFANVTTARDSKRAQTTMTLAPKSKGAKAKQAYAVRTHEMGGMAQVSRECKFL